MKFLLCWIKLKETAVRGELSGSTKPQDMSNFRSGCTREEIFPILQGNPLWNCREIHWREGGRLLDVAAASQPGGAGGGKGWVSHQRHQRSIRETEIATGATHSQHSYCTMTNSERGPKKFKKSDFWLDQHKISFYQKPNYTSADRGIEHKNCSDMMMGWRMRGINSYILI